MKMVMVVVPSNTAENVLDALVNAGYTATYAETTGGMLRQSQYSLFIAVKKEELDSVLGIIKEHCRTHIEMSTRIKKVEIHSTDSSLTADLGGGVAFIWDIDQIQTL